MTEQHSTLGSLFARNKAWAKSMTDDNPDFFTHLSKQQSPEYLWIGCADSRVPANQVVDLPPGEVFVHRNIANVVVHSDLNCLSVLQFAVEELNVKHIIICGHYDCGGVKAALDGNRHGLIDNWLGHLRDVYRLHKLEIDALPTMKDKVNCLCEKNVIEQVSNVCRTTIVQDAWIADKDLTIHGLIYSIDNGLLKSLETKTSHPDLLRFMHPLNT